MVETSDVLYQLQFVVSTLLNGIIVLQFFLYWSGVKKVGPKAGAATKSTKATKGESKKNK